MTRDMADELVAKIMRAHPATGANVHNYCNKTAIVQLTAGLIDTLTDLNEDTAQYEVILNKATMDLLRWVDKQYNGSLYRRMV